MYVEQLTLCSQYVRRRTLMAFRTLSEQSTDILRRILGKMRQRLNDEDFTVVSAALTVSITLMTVCLSCLVCTVLTENCDRSS